MSENQKFYEEFLRNFNLTTPTPLLALEYETLTSTQTISTISGQYASTKGTPTPTFEAKELDLEAFSWMYWTPFILDAVVPALVFSVFYLFRVICIVLFKIAKLKARHPKVPFSQTRGKYWRKLKHPGYWDWVWSPGLLFYRKEEKSMEKTRVEKNNTE